MKTPDKLIMKGDSELQDKWLVLTGVPLIAFFSALAGKTQMFGLYDEPFLKLFITMTIFTYGMWEVCRRILLYNRRNNPGIDNTQKRIVKVFILYTIAVVLVISAFVFLVSVLNVFPGYQWKLVYAGAFFLTCLTITYSLGAIYEGVYFFRHWKASAIRTENLKKESLQTQFESLKSQLNPHFLFNSLNSLLSLVDDDPDRAEVFVHEMSRVYRYLLQSNDRPLTAVEAEMDFIKAYFYLLLTRFGNNLKYEISIREDLKEYYIPPLTLQILVENAVKHNVVSAGKPLTVRIFTNDKNELVVSNNLQPKAQPVISNKIGLKNISTKYKLLNQTDIIISRTEQFFEVRVPLIKEPYEYRIKEKSNEKISLNYE